MLSRKRSRNALLTVAAKKLKTKERRQANKAYEIESIVGECKIFSELLKKKNIQRWIFLVVKTMTFHSLIFIDEI